MKRTIILVFAYFVFLQSVFSQITTNESPVSIQRGLGVLTKDNAKGFVNLPIPDMKKILDEDSVLISNKPNSFKRTSISIPLILNPNENGVWTVLEDGGKLWQMEIRAQKALALDFVFSKFW